MDNNEPENLQDDCCNCPDALLNLMGIDTAYLKLDTVTFNLVPPDYYALAREEREAKTVRVTVMAQNAMPQLVRLLRRGTTLDCHDARG